MKRLKCGWGLTAMVVVFGLLMFWGCEEEYQVSLPDVDTVPVYYTDTITVRAFTRLQKAIPTANSERFLFGCMNDPVLGQVSAQFASQVSVSSDNLYLDFVSINGDDTLSNTYKLDSILSIDSVALNMVVWYDTDSEGNTQRDYYGNSAIGQTLKVYKVNQKINSLGYYSDSDMGQLDLEYLGENTFIYSSSGSIAPTSSSVSVALSDEITQWLRHWMSSRSVSDLLAMPGNFTEDFKGLCVIPEKLDKSIEGGLCVFAPDSSALRLYCTVDVNDSIMQAPIDLPLSGNNFQTYDFDYSGTEFEAIINDSLAGMTHDYLYVQSLGGLGISVEIPYLEQLTDSIAILQASLVLDVDYAIQGYELDPPEDMYIYSHKPNGDSTFLLTEYMGTSTSSSSTVAANYNGAPFNTETGRYDLNITRHVQQFLVGNSSASGFYIIPNIQATNSYTNRYERGILYNGNAQDGAFKMVITYTKLWP